MIAQVGGGRISGMSANPYEPPKRMEKLKGQHKWSLRLGALFGLLSTVCAFAAILVAFRALSLPALWIAFLAIAFGIAAMLLLVWAFLSSRGYVP